MQNGMDENSTLVSLAKQYVMACEGDGDITLPKETLKLILMSVIQSWHVEQDKRRAELKKAQV